MFRKSLAVLMVISMVLALLVGCGSKDKTETKDTTSQKSQEKSGDSTKKETSKETKKKNVKLDFLWFADGVETEVMQEIMAAYEEENPHVTFNLIEVAYKDVDAKLRTMIAGGQPPALARTTNPGLLFEHAVDITDALGGYEAFTSQYMSSLEPYYTKDNHAYAIPMDVTANGLFYNKTLFDQAGVQVPQSPDDVWTWEEFEQIVKDVRGKTDAKYGLLWDFSPHRWTTMLYEFGGSLFAEDGSKATINSAEGVKALTYFKKLHDEDVIPKSVWLGGENPNNLFRSGTAVAHFSGNWMLSNYRDITDFEWGVTYAPKEATRSSVPGGKYLMAFDGSDVEEEAANFLEFFSRTENTGKYCRESLFISPRKDNSSLDYEYAKEWLSIFANELDNTPPSAAMDWSRQDIMPTVYGDIKEKIVEALLDHATPQEAFDSLADIINDAINEKE